MITKTNYLLIKYTATQSGSSMAKAIKSYARKFDNCIVNIDLFDQLVLGDLARERSRLEKTTPRWRSVNYQLDRFGHCDGVSKCYGWVYIDGEPLFTLSRLDEITNED